MGAGQRCGATKSCTLHSLMDNHAGIVRVSAMPSDRDTPEKPTPPAFRRPLGIDRATASSVQTRPSQHLLTLLPVSFRGPAHGLPFAQRLRVARGDIRIVG